MRNFIIHISFNLLYIIFELKYQVIKESGKDKARGCQASYKNICIIYMGYLHPYYKRRLMLYMRQ